MKGIWGYMKDSVKKLVFLGAVALFIIAIVVIKKATAEDDFHEKYAGTDLTQDIEGASRENTYTLYQLSHKDAAYAKTGAEVAISDVQAGEGVRVENNIEGADTAVFTDTESEATWKVNIPETGLYNINVDFLTVESRGVSVERSILINDKLPFADAENIIFKRQWHDGAEKRIDNRGNEIRPTQSEIYTWQTSVVEDKMGYITDPYEFYLEAGENTVTLKGVNEPVYIKKIEFVPVKNEFTYQDYLAANGGTAGTTNNSDTIVTIQGEDSTLRSEQSLYARYDKASASTKPYSVEKQLLNYIGGDAWGTSGMWIQWDFEVPSDGWYNITVKGRQNYQRGAVSTRTLYIDGEVPFDEAKLISFEYANDWELNTLSDAEGNPYSFKLSAGKHTIRLKASLGMIGSVLEELEDSIFRLNQIYRTILVYTGPQPDKYRDYHIERKYPDVMKALELEMKRLYKIVDDVVELTGQKGDKIASAQTIANQIERFIDKPDRITAEFVSFKDNITALGTAALNMAETKLDVDYILVSSTGAEIEDDTANWFERAAHEVRSFFASYYVDYNSVGDVYEESDDEKVVKVWILQGRDQGSVLKSLIDDDFTPNTGIKVNLEVVQAGAVLNAVLAGRGPNVILSAGGDVPVNYALRGAVEDLRQFDDLDEVLSHYTPSSYTQYGLDGALYGIPETQNFCVMFYRKDVLEQLGLKVPDTWDELNAMFPTIQGNNMMIGIPSAAGSSSSAAGSTAVLSNSPDLSLYFSLLYQNGGEMYTPDATKSIIDEEAGVQAIKQYTEYFTDYGIPIFYDFVSRFRSGEMPIGISYYNIYNTLMVSAPEIKGLWDFTLIPGTEKVDENGNTYIDRTDCIVGNASIMIKEEDEELKQMSWEFLKWWDSVDTQIRFGREMEALLGPSARYATANFDAFSQLAWSASDVKTLTEQWKQTRGIMEVPGGYYTGRHVTNAVRRIITYKEDPRETILDYVIQINDEITKKRKEFGMPIAED